jgi:hypothetical protein
MATRAAICIGVNRPGSLPPLQGAARGATDFADWARKQSCDTVLLTDDNGKAVALTDVTKAVRGYVDKGTYTQLFVYFSGHGFLKAPESEYWLLSAAPEEPGEAVNLNLSIVYSRSCGIPHVVFISDACRSLADAKLMPVTGQTIFPYKQSPPPRPAVDTFYATQPGDPSYETKLSDTDLRYAGIFTSCLLTTVVTPDVALVETIDEASTRVSVVLSDKLKVLETDVPLKAAGVNITLRQSPEVRAESHRPQFFARLGPVAAAPPAPPPSAPPPPAPPPPPSPRAVSPARGTKPPEAMRPLGTVVAEVAESHFWSEGTLPQEEDAIALGTEVDRLAGTHGRTHFETMTGLTVHGARVRAVNAPLWQHDVFPDPNDPAVTHVRLHDGIEPDKGEGGSLLLQLEPDVSTVLAVIPGFIATVVADDTRILTVSYIPSDLNWRYQEYRWKAKELDRMRAFAAVASRHGQFVVKSERAATMADRLRSMKYLDPTLGLYAAYAYGQAGLFDQVVSILGYMAQDSAAIPFDVAMLAARQDPDGARSLSRRLAPFCPMLTQGWSLFDAQNPLYSDLHARLQPQLRPSLWSCFNSKGAELVLDAFAKGEVR